MRPGSIPLRAGALDSRYKCGLDPRIGETRKLEARWRRQKRMCDPREGGERCKGILNSVCSQRHHWIDL